MGPPTLFGEEFYFGKNEAGDGGFVFKQALLR